MRVKVQFGAVKASARLTAHIETGSIDVAYVARHADASQAEDNKAFWFTGAARRSLSIDGLGEPDDVTRLVLTPLFALMHP